MTDDNLTGMEIAVIGMAGRFPAAKDLEEYWQNLKNGVESTAYYSEEELIGAGVEPAQAKAPDYVKTGGSNLEEKEYFDAAFFGYKPLEAEIMDPQTRLFLETSWHALEDAGYDPGVYPGLIGLYGGSAWNFLWEAAVRLSGRGEALGEFTSWLYTNRDNLCTLVSYNLGLKGPSVYMKTTCSTSLTAVHMAVQALLNGECEMAAAGGVAVGSGKKTGYRYREGMIQSPDGHCRAFDAEAKGTVAGEGVGVVVLKRYAAANAENDHIYAVIKGTAVNNDGTRKIGYTAPSIPGQVDVIREALQVAGVEPESITYVETHGTGTPVGDPIEIEALQTALDPKGDQPPVPTQTCYIGSLKTNIGHLDAAAGIAAFIKTVQALQHKLIPPSLHYQKPNPKIDFENSRLRVNTGLTEWKNEKNPLRAGVSSFGIGGTNVHIVLEEAPAKPAQPAQPPARPNHLLLLSAKTPSALEKMTENLAAYMKKNPGIPLADVAYTLQSGRRAFNHRRMLVCTAREEAVSLFSAARLDPRKVPTAEAAGQNPRIVFMYPGLGGQYVDMGRELYETEPYFRETIDTCFAKLTPLLGTDLKEVLYPFKGVNRSHTSNTSRNSSMPGIPPGIDHIDIAQPVLFVFEYALAQLLMKWGIKPAAMIGYSFGEYTAACISGVLTLEEALELIVTRGKLLQETPEGAMMSVPLPKEELQPYLEGSGLSLAVDNGPSCIVSGAPTEIRAFESLMKKNRYVCTPLPQAVRALHSHYMKPVLPALAAALGRYTLQEPQIPYISNVTGRWVEAGEVTRPAYWTTHMSETVRFAEGIKELLKTPGTIFIEVGPGYDLSVLVRHHTEKSTGPLTVHLFNKARGTTSEHRYLLNKIGEIWMAGVNIDWGGYYGEERRQRISLPQYPFERQRYWVDSDPANPSARQAITRAAGEIEPGKKPGKAEWFYVPTWKRSVPANPHRKKTREKGSWLVFIDETGIGEQFARRLEQEGEETVKIRIGGSYEKISPREYVMNPNQPRDYQTIFEEIRGEAPPARVAHFWTVTAKEKSIEELLDLGFYSMIYLAQAAGREGITGHLQILVISDHMQRVTSGETLSPGKATVLGAVKVIPREYFNISCRSIDICRPGDAEQEKRLIEQIYAEFAGAGAGTETPETVAAYRGEYRWEQVYEPLRLELPGDDGAGNQGKNPLLKPRGVYMITGGMGGIGMELAGHLAREVQARLVLTGRRSFPPREQWEQWQSEHAPQEPVSQKIQQLQALEKTGAEVLVCTADVSEKEQMQGVVTQAKHRYGTINGVIHAAGIPDGGMIPMRTRETLEPVLAPKVKGTLVLDRVLEENRITPDFFILCSSISAVLGMFGQVAYCAANAYLDAYADYKTHEKGEYTVSIDWDFWQEVGMGVETVKRLQESAEITDAHLLLKNGLLTEEGIGAFDRILGTRNPQVIVSPLEFTTRLKQGGDYRAGSADSAGERAPAGKSYPRPVMTTEYKAPGTGFEKAFSSLLQEYFGFEQVGIDDNLFEYGLTSLDMIHINNTMRERIGPDIPIIVMFENPTIRMLGGWLESREKGPQGQLEDLEEVEGILHDSIDIFDNFKA